MVEPKLHLEGEVAVPYRWSYGRTLTRFFEGTSARRILAARCTACRKVLVPPTQVCGACWAATEEPWLEVGPAGVITACTTVYLSFPGQPKDPPYTWATIRLDGADTGFFGIVEEVPHEEVRVGMRVEPVWSEDPKGDLYDIRHFRPVGA